MIPNRLLRCILCLSTAGLAGGLLLSASVCHAVEGGSGVYGLGFTSPQAGLMPEPGTYGNYYFYAYKGDASANVSASTQIPIPGTELKAQLSVTGTLKVEIDPSYAHIFQLTHVFNKQLLGGTPGITLTVPYASTDLNVSGNGVLTLTGPLGNSFSTPIGGKLSSSESGLGDVIVTGMLGWHDGVMHYMGMFNVYTPTGDYDKNRIVNLGRNHWAYEPMLGITYLNPTSGRELSAAAGITFNQENPDTHYKSGNEFHLDVSAIQHFSDKFYAGLSGYAYHQLTGDSGSGATSDFKGRVYALGPIVGGTIPIGQKQNLYLKARYYKEFDAKNRLEGDAFYLSASIKF